MENKNTDTVIQEVWEIKDALTKEASGDLDKLVELIKVKAEQANVSCPVVNPLEKRTA